MAAEAAFVIVITAFTNVVFVLQKKMTAAAYAANANTGNAFSEKRGPHLNPIKDIFSSERHSVCI